MTSYRIFETDQFDSDLKRIAKAGQRNVLQKLRRIVYPQLRYRPHFGPHVKKLKDYTPLTWRYRIGAWRFFYEIDEEDRTVAMIAASHRGAAY